MPVAKPDPGVLGLILAVAVRASPDPERESPGLGIGFRRDSASSRSSISRSRLDNSGLLEGLDRLIALFKNSRMPDAIAIHNFP